MSVNTKAREDASLASPAVLKAMLDITQRFQNLEQDLVLLRARIDAGERPRRMIYPVLSAQLMASELLGRLVQMQIMLADEDDE